MNRIKLLLSIIFTVTTYTVFSQLTVDGEFRSRMVLDHGYKMPVKKGSDIALSFDQRTRLILNFENEKLTTRFTLQDARVWGGDNLYNSTGFMGNANAFGIYEAWVDLRLKGNNFLRVGRQEWNYDDGRILTNRNWWTSGISYDGILFRSYNKEETLFLDIGVSYNNNGNRNGGVDNSFWSDDKLKTMNFFNLKQHFSNKLTASIMLTLAGRQIVDDNKFLGIGTYGINVKYNTGEKTFDGLLFNVSAYYQSGKDKEKVNGEYREIMAYFVAAELGFRTLRKKLELSVGMELISGHDYSNNDDEYNSKYHSFDLFYSARYRYYGGHMNYFLLQDSYTVGTKGGGYFDPYFKMKYKITSKDIFDFAVYMPQLTTKVQTHTFFMDYDRKVMIPEYNTNGDPVYWKGNLGTNFDLGYTRKFSKEVVLKVGFSYAIVSDIKNQMIYGYKNNIQEELYELGNNYFGYAILIVKPRFFDSRK